VQKKDSLKPDAKSASLPSSKSAPAKPDPKAAASKAEPVKPAIADTPADSTQYLEPELVTVTAESNSTLAPTPLATASNLAIERSTPPPMPDRIDLSNSGAENQSIQPISSPPAGAKKATPSSQPKASAAAASRTPVPAVPISRTSPVYPELAIRARSSGTVALDLEIDKAGKVTKATPVSGPSVFYDAAVKAAMKWRYKPATINGANISSKSRVTMVFNLER
jgi:TonB family protein